MLLASVIAGSSGDELNASYHPPAYRIVLPERPGAPILITTDSHLWTRSWPGDAWRVAKLPRPAGWAYDLQFTSMRSGWVASANCMYRREVLVFRTVNGGRTWRASRSGVGVNCAAGTTVQLDFIDDDHGWIVANFGNSIFSDVAATRDGGRTWRDRADSLPLRGEVHFLDKRRGWLVTHHPFIRQDIARTLDGGRTWARPRIKIPTPYPRFYPCLQGPPRLFGDNGVLPALLRRSHKLTAAFFRTRDGGASWMLVARRELDHPVRLHRFVDGGEPCPQGIVMRVATPTVWWLVTRGGRVAQVTRNGGMSWHRVAMPAFRSAAFADLQSWDADRALLTLSNQRETRLFSTTDGGATWRKIRLPAALPRG